MPSDERNLILIGMLGVGKSTVGVLLAKATRRSFIDTDVYIQAGQGRSLQEIIDAQGLVAFCRIEEQCILSLKLRGHVIATGGSAVYSNAAMGFLRSTGPVVHLDLALDLLEKRLENLRGRGVVMAPGRRLKDLYVERQPLYRAWADITLDGAGKTQDQVVAEILRQLRLDS